MKKMKIFITGGTSGIGLELAKLYLREGHDVGVCGRDLSKLPAEILHEFSNLESFELSVTDEDALKKAILSFSKDAGLDLIIASAGRSHGKKSILPDFEVGKNIFQTNVIGVLNTFDPALEVMLPQKRGHLVAISSVAGLIGLPGAAAYSASKSAVLKLCESYGLDLEKYGIAVSAIAPGFIDTPLTRKNNHQMPFLMEVEEGAMRIKKAIEKKAPLYIFPKRMKFAVVFLSLIPRSWYRGIMKIPLLNYSE